MQRALAEVMQCNDWKGQHFMRHSIRKRLRMVLLGLSIVPVLLVEMVVAYLSFSLQRERTIRFQEQTAKHVARQMATVMAEIEHDLLMVVRLRDAGEVGLTDQGLLLELLSHRDALDELALLDRAGQEQVRVPPREGVAAGEFQDRADALEFRAPKSSGTSYLSPVWFDDSTGEPMITLATPVIDVRGNDVNSVLVGDVRLRSLWDDTIAGIALEADGTVCLVDAQSRIVAHGDPSMVSGDARFAVPERPGFIKPPSGPYACVAFHSLSLWNQEFTVVVERPVHKAMAQLLGVTVLMVVCVIIPTLVVAYVAAQRLTRKIVEPIQALSATARAIKEGDLSQRVVVVGEDEIGELSKTFNSMAAQLQTSLESLEKEVTERKQAEEERLSLERQVQHAQKLESLGVLAGGIAHDFNNLLMAILGNADLALGELSPMSPARDNLQEIEKASRRAAGLAKQMLAYSGKGRFVVEPIELGELVKEMAHLLEVSISKKVVLKYNFAENLPPFDGDVTQIRQVVMNLITNASEAIGDKSGAIALSTGAMDCDRAYLDGVNEVLRAGLDEPLPEGVYTYVEVADTGCGMDAETIQKIFDPFFTTKFTGRGLGMSAVLGIVRGHQGAIKIYSEVGKGTTFKLLFPASEPPEEERELAQAKQGTSEDVPVPGFSGTILLVDDEETVRVVSKQMLERMGFTVLTAPDGREALKVFREHAGEIVCVLLDLTMPHMDGDEAFREMRRLHPGVTVILCSGYNEQDATQRFPGKGLAGFIQKPYTLAALEEKLREVLPATDEGEQ